MHHQALARQLAQQQDAVLAAYGERWYRIWHFFLAWSTIIGEQGNAACFQVVRNKNLDSFDRTRWDRPYVAPCIGDRMSVIQAPAARSERVEAAE